MLSKGSVLLALLVIAIPLTSAQVNTKDVTYCCCCNFNNMFSSIWLTEVFLSPSPTMVAGTSRARESHGPGPLHHHHHGPGPLHHHHHGPGPLLYRFPRASQVFRVVVVLVKFRPQRPEASSFRGRPQNTNLSASKSSSSWNPARGRRQLRMLESSSALLQLSSQPPVARGGRSLLSFPIIGREQVSPTLSLRPLWNILECQILGKF